MEDKPASFLKINTAVPLLTKNPIPMLLPKKICLVVECYRYSIDRPYCNLMVGEYCQQPTDLYGDAQNQEFRIGFLCSLSFVALNPYSFPHRHKYC